MKNIVQFVRQELLGLFLKSFSCSRTVHVVRHFTGRWRPTRHAFEKFLRSIFHFQSPALAKTGKIYLMEQLGTGILESSSCRRLLTLVTTFLCSCNPSSESMQSANRSTFLSVQVARDRLSCHHRRS